MSSALPPLVAIQRNRLSGSGIRQALLRDLVVRLRELGLRPRLFSNRARMQAWLDLEANRRELRCIVAAGGDGTVGDLLNRYPGLPLAILPLGTENLLARYLGIPRNGRAVAELIAGGHFRRIDLCAVGDQRFAVMASLGFDADIIHRTHARRRGNITKWNYLQPIYESLRKYEHPDLELFLDDEPEPLRGRLALLVNLPVYALGLPVAGSACGEDGKIDLRLFEGGSPLQMVRYFCSVMARMHEDLSDVRIGRATRVRIESQVPVPVQVDGDPAGWTPCELRVLPGALDVVVPPPPAEWGIDPVSRDKG